MMRLVNLFITLLSEQGAKTNAGQISIKWGIDMY